MGRVVPAVALPGCVALLAGLGWAYAVRAERLHPGVTVTLLVGVVSCLAAVAAAVVRGRRPRGLAVPDGFRLPSPEWGWAVTVVGLAAGAGGMLASWPVGVLGAVLVGVGLVAVGRRLEGPQVLADDTDGTPDLAAEPVPGSASTSELARTAPATRRGGSPVPRPVLDRAAVVAARRVRSFGARHGGPGDVEVAVQHLGRGLTRLVLLGADGAWGDVVVRGAERASLAASLAGARLLDDLDGDAAARLRTGRYEWRRMAGQQLPVGRRR